jgi:cell division protein FtsN
MVAVLIVTFVVLLNMMSQMVKELLAGNTAADLVKDETVLKKTLPIAPLPEQQTVATVSTKKEETAVPKQSVEDKMAKPEVAKTEPAKPEEPRYDFYTILPQAEVVVPDYEIKTRVREELVGKNKTAKYLMQAGSFRDAPDAERLKLRLAQLGIDSKIESAKIGNVMWHRVKVGPYDDPSSVSKIKEMLTKNGIGVIVTETGSQ